MSEMPTPYYPAALWKTLCEVLDTSDRQSAREAAIAIRQFVDERAEQRRENERLREREKVWEKRWNILYDRGEGFGERDIPNEMLGIEEDLPLPDTETAPVEEGEGCGQPDPEQMVRWLRYAGS